MSVMRSSEKVKDGAPLIPSPPAPVAVTKLPVLQSLGLAAIYIGTSVSYFLGIRYTKKSIPYDAVMVVFTLECIKLLVCFVAYHIQTGESMIPKLLPSALTGNRETHTGSSGSALWKRGLPYAVPSFIYAVYNNLTFFNLQRIDPGTYQVLLQTKILVTGVLFTFFFREFLSVRQWGALVLLMVGVSCKFVGSPDGDAAATSHGAPTPSVIAVLMVVFQGFLSAFAGVYNEYAFKKDAGLSIHVQNFFMYFYALVFNIIIALVTTDVRQIQFSLLKRPAFLMVAALGAACGLSAAFLLKFINVLVKGFAGAVEVLITAVAARLLLGEPLGRFDLLSAVLVTVALAVYYTKGRWGHQFVSFGLAPRRVEILP